MLAEHSCPSGAVIIGKIAYLFALLYFVAAACVNVCPGPFWKVCVQIGGVFDQIRDVVFDAFGRPVGVGSYFGYANVGGGGGTLFRCRSHRSLCSIWKSCI